jgi:hypothetical protein
MNKEMWKRYWVPLKYLFGMILSGWIVNAAFDLLVMKSTIAVIGGVTVIALVLLFWWNHFMIVHKCIMEEKDEKSKADVTGAGSAGTDGMSGLQDNPAGGSGNKN